MLRKIIRIVEMNDTLIVRLNNLCRQQHATGNILADLAGHIVALHAVYRRILIGIFLLYLLVIALNQRQNLLIRSVGLSNHGANVTVGNILARKIKSTQRHDLIFDQVLDFFNAHRAIHSIAHSLNVRRSLMNLRRRQPI